VNRAGSARSLAMQNARFPAFRSYACPLVLRAVVNMLLMSHQRDEYQVVIQLEAGTIMVPQPRQQA
jgi:hypothetical protein